ncbi:MAG TPA: hypothetical protein VN832_01105 [Stellaceae bacterium]|nr:hypothetical protein [Stellaceae bacterium]
MAQFIAAAPRATRRGNGFAAAHDARFVERQIRDLGTGPRHGPLLLDTLYGETLDALLPRRLSALLSARRAA